MLQRPAQLLRRQQLLQRDAPAAQPAQLPAQVAQGFGHAWPRFFTGRCSGGREARQPLQQPPSGPRRMKGGVSPRRASSPRILPATRPGTPQNNGSPPAHAHPPARAGTPPAVDALQGDRQPRAPAISSSSGCTSCTDSLPASCKVALHPQPIDIHVQHRVAQVLGGLFGAQQALAAVSGHRLVRLDAPEAGVLIPQVAKAGHQQPLMRRGAPPCTASCAVPARQPGDALLQGYRLSSSGPAFAGSARAPADPPGPAGSPGGQPSPARC